MPQVLARPIKVTTTNNDFVYYEPYSAGSGTSLALDTGLYGDIGSVCYNLQSKIRTVQPSFTISFENDTGKIVMQNPSSSWRITFSDADLADLLGFDGTSITENIYRAETDDVDQDNRTLEYFLEQCLSAKPISGTYKSPKGFWLFYNVNQMQVEEFSDTFEGIYYNRSISGSIKTYCHTTPRAFRKYPASYSKHKERYNVSMEVNTAYFAASDFA
jgi:hypothetical protein